MKRSLDFTPVHAGGTMQKWVWWEDQIGADTATKTKDYGNLNENIKWTNLTSFKEIKLTELVIDWMWKVKEGKN